MRGKNVRGTRQLDLVVRFAGKAIDFHLNRMQAKPYQTSFIVRCVELRPLDQPVLIASFPQRLIVAQNPPTNQVDDEWLRFKSLYRGVNLQHLGGQLLPIALNGDRAIAFGAVNDVHGPPIGRGHFSDSEVNCFERWSFGVIHPPSN